MREAKKPVNTEYLTGADLSDATLLDMSNLRRRVMHMKPDTDLDQDFAHFCEFCRASSTVVLFRNPEKQLVGMVNYMLRREISREGQRYLFLIGDYGFMLHDYRGHPALPLSFARVFFRTILAWRGEPLYFGGIGYPTAVLMFNKMFGQAFISGQRELPPLAASALQVLLDDVAGARWDGVRGSVCMPTIPPVMSARWEAYAQAQPIFHRYLEYCPNWREGYALALVGPVQVSRVLLRALGKGVKRLLR